MRDKNRQINKTWIKYKQMVLKEPLTERERVEAFKGFLGGWMAAYRFMWGLITEPPPNAVEQVQDLKDEIEELRAIANREKK